MIAAIIVLSLLVLAWILTPPEESEDNDITYYE